VLPVHWKQLFTQLKLKDFRLTLLINFGAGHLKNGIRRIANNLWVRPFARGLELRDLLCKHSEPPPTWSFARAFLFILKQHCDKPKFRSPETRPRARRRPRPRDCRVWALQLPEQNCCGKIGCFKVRKLKSRTSTSTRTIAKFRDLG
jgi:hypothetical protein